MALAPQTRSDVLGRAARPLWAGSRLFVVPLAARQDFRRLQGLTGVRHVEIVRRRTASATHGDLADPLFAQQGYLPDIGWTAPAPASPRPIVAVLDTGVVPVADLADRVMQPEARSFIAGRSPLEDSVGHGTHVAGIIAAATGNGIGMSGVADAWILPVTVADSTGGATTASLIQGLRYAVQRGARVVNISFAGPGYSALEQEAIDAAAAKGVLVVAASGNSGPAIGRLEYPAAYRHVLAVGATGPGQVPLPISTQGPQVSVAAPGSNVISTNTQGEGPAGFVLRTGTSVAAPMASGIAARLLVAHPQLDATQLRAMIQGSATDVAPPGVDDATGHGLVNLTAALAAAVPARDPGEPNDEPAQSAKRRPLFLRGAVKAVRTARVEAWSDPRDVYTVRLAKGDRIEADLSGDQGSDLDLSIWRPGAPAAGRSGGRDRRWLAAFSVNAGSTERLAVRATQSGPYSIEVRLADGPGSAYALRATRIAPKP